MSGNRIVIKLGGIIILLFLVILLPLGFVIDQIFSGFYYSKVQNDIDQLSSRYAESIASSSNPTIIDMIALIAQFAQVHLYIVDAQGRVIANSQVPGLPKGSYLSEKEVNTLSKGESIKKEYEDPVLGDRFLVRGTPIMRENAFDGGVYVLSSIESIYQSIERVRYLLALSLVGALFLALAFTFVLSVKLSDPLIEMERATRKIAKGMLDTRVHVSSRDELGSLAEAVNDLAKNLQRYRDTQREFFANISHELRTPITYLEGYAKVVKEGHYQTEEEKELYIEIIYQESKRLTRMIEDLFELSRMEEGKIDLHLKAIDLADVMERVIRKVKPRAKEKALEIKLEIENPLPFVLADGLRMEQIFFNLIDNAIRYTVQGRIRISMQPSEEQKLVIQLEDTGIGIPAQELPYIFERFYRVEKSRSRAYGGTGLGLAIVKQFVDLQGGVIEVSSVVGKGTCFIMTFPVASTLS